MKFVFAPVAILTGLLAGIIARKGFEAAWGVIDDEEPPDPGHRDVPTVKLIAALAIEGAIFRVAKGFADHGARRAFASFTGRWPGEEAPEKT